MWKISVRKRLEAVAGLQREGWEGARGRLLPVELGGLLRYKIVYGGFLNRDKTTVNY
jgi:hypothetical protein